MIYYIYNIYIEYYSVLETLEMSKIRPSSSSSWSPPTLTGNFATLAGGSGTYEEVLGGSPWLPSWFFLHEFPGRIPRFCHDSGFQDSSSKEWSLQPLMSESDGMSRYSSSTSNWAVIWLALSFRFLKIEIFIKKKIWKKVAVWTRVHSSVPFFLQGKDESTLQCTR